MQKHTVPGASLTDTFGRIKYLGVQIIVCLATPTKKPPPIYNVLNLLRNSPPRILFEIRIKISAAVRKEFLIAWVIFQTHIYSNTNV